MTTKTPLNGLADYYNVRLDTKKNTSEQLGWENQSAHYRRFSILCEETNYKKASLLDVGSGLGDLYAFLKEQSFSGRYTGVDVLPRMVELAKKRFPELPFYCADLISDPGTMNQAFDICYCSGVFNLKEFSGNAFLKKAFESFTKLSNRWIVLSLLHKRSPDKEEDLYCYFEPEEVLELLAPYAWQLKIRDDYLDNDFTLIAEKL